MASRRIDLNEIVRKVRWNQTVARPKLEDVARLRPRTEQHGPRTPATLLSTQASAEDQETEGRQQPGRVGRWLVALPVLALLFGVAVVAGLRSPWFSAAEPTGTATPEPSSTLRLATATLTSAPTATPAAVVVLLPTVTPTSSPTLTPSPTPPMVVARSAPSILYQARGQGDRNWSIYAMSSDGSDRIQLTDGSFNAYSPVWSPDGSRIAYVSDRDESLDIWVMDQDGSNSLNLSRHEAQDRMPAWSPDGNWIAFASVRDALYWEIYVIRPDGSELRRLTWWEDASDWEPAWSPDSTRLAFSSKRDGNWEIYIMDLAGENLVRLTEHAADDTRPAWSPDGGRIAFESTREGYTDIYLVPVVGGIPQNLTDASWATDLGPTWSPDGGRIAFYSDRDGEWDIYVMASDGSGMVKLTGDGMADQVPCWRP